MLNVILSHWAIYLYAVLLLVVAVLFVRFLPQQMTVYRKVARYSRGSRLMPARWRVHRAR